MYQALAFPLTDTEKAAAVTDTHVLDDYPVNGAAPPTYHDATKHDKPTTRWSPSSWSPRTFLVITWVTLTTLALILLASTQPLTRLPHFISGSNDSAQDHVSVNAPETAIDRTSASARLPEHALTKRTDAGQMDNMMLWVLCAGVGIALIVGVTTSWVLQRKQFGNRNRKDKKGAVWRSRMGQVV